MNPDLIEAFLADDKVKIKELINLKDEKGLTPLHAYLLNEANPDPNTVAKMLENGADVNVYYGERPLLTDLIMQKPKLNPEILKLILEKGHLKPFLTITGSPETLSLMAQAFYSSENYKNITEYESKYQEEMARTDPKSLKGYLDYLNIIKFLKQKGHSLGISSAIIMKDPDSKDVRVGFEGNQNVHSMASLLHFMEGYQSSIAVKRESERIAEYLSHIRDAYKDVLGYVSLEKSPKDLLEKIKNDKVNPTILTSGWMQHTLSIAFFGDYIILSNRGGGREKVDFGTRIYKRTPETDKLLTEEFIKNLQDPTVDSETILKRVNQLLPSLNFLEEMASEDQKHGTCSFVNHKSIMQPILYLMELKRLAKEKGVSEDDKAIKTLAQDFAKKEYKNFTHWMRDREIDDIAAQYKSEVIPKTILNQLVSAYIEEHFKPDKAPRNPAKRGEEIERAFRLLQAMEDNDRIAYLTTLIIDNNNPLLQAAVSYGDKKVADFILKNMEKTKTIWYAMNQADTLLIEKAIAMNDNLNINFSDGTTPLTLALCKNLPKDIIELLLKRGADVNLRDMKGIFPLELAISNNLSKDTIIMLLDRISDLNMRLSDGSTPFLCALEAGLSKEYIKSLIKRGADVAIPRLRDGDSKRPALVVAASVPDNTEVLELLLKHGATVDQTDDEGDNALSLSLAIDKNEINLEFLAKRTANINHTDMVGAAAINLACINGNLKYTKILHKYGADINHIVLENQSSPIFDAIQSEHQNYDLVKYLIDNHADLKHLGPGSNPALLHAVNFGNSKIINLLLDQNMDVNQTNSEHKTALMILAMSFNANLGTAEALLKHGADLNAKDEDGKTALDIARETNKVELVKFLEEAGKQLEAKPEKPKESKDTGAVPILFSTPKLEPEEPKSSEQSKPKI